MTSRWTKACSRAWAVIPFLVIVAGCKGNESTASRSAAAYDAERAKGVVAPGAGGAHGGHGDAQPTASAPSADTAGANHSAMDHSNMPALDHSNMPGMDHSNMAGMKPATGSAPRSGQSSTAAMDHSNMPGMDHSNMPGMKPASGSAARSGQMDHSKMDHSKSPKMDHSNMPGMDHSKMPGMGSMTMAPPRPEPKSSTATPGQPATVLQSDELDRPASTSVEDAARSAAMNAEMAGGGHGMSHGSYQHLDAGRDNASPPASGHEGHQMPKPQPSPSGRENRR